MQYTSTRTQIILPKHLRREIDQARKSTSESLGQYLRSAVIDRLKQTQQKTINLKHLANAVVGQGRAADWSKQKAIRWQQILRTDRNDR